MAACSSICAWKMPWTGKSDGLQSMGSQRIRHDQATDTYSIKNRKSRKTGLQGSNTSSGQGGAHTRKNMDGKLTDCRNRQLIRMSKVTQAQDGWEHVMEGCGLWQTAESCFSWKWQLLSNSQLCETVHPGSPVLPTLKKKLENHNFKRRSFLFNVGNEINWKAQQIKPSLQGCQSGTSATKSLTATWLQKKKKKKKTQGFSSHSQNHCFCLTSLILSKRKPFKRSVCGYVWVWYTGFEIFSPCEISIYCVFLVYCMN